MKAQQSVICIESNNSLKQGLALMKEHKIHHLVVRDTLSKKTLGIVNELDLRRQLSGEIITSVMISTNQIGILDSGKPTEKGPAGATIGSVTPPYDDRITQDSSLIETMRWAIEFHATAVPICDHGQIIGLVTVHDLLAAINRVSGQEDSSVERFFESSKNAINVPLSHPLIVNLVQMISEAGI